MYCWLISRKISRAFALRMVESVYAVVAKQDLWDALYTLGTVVVEKGGLVMVEFLRMVIAAELRDNSVGVGSLCLGLWIKVAESWECEELMEYLEGIGKVRRGLYCDFGESDEAREQVVTPISVEEVMRIIASATDTNEKIKALVADVPDLVERLENPWDTNPSDGLLAPDNVKLKRNENSVLSLNAFSGGLDVRRASEVDHVVTAPVYFELISVEGSVWCK
jgi:hypothetical protein